MEALKYIYSLRLFRFAIDVVIVVTALGASLNGDHYTAIILAYVAGYSWPKWESRQ